MHNLIQVGKRFSTGNIRFEIVRIEPESIYNSVVWIRFLSAGCFSGWVIDCNSSDIGAGIISGEILLIENNNNKKDAYE